MSPALAEAGWTEAGGGCAVEWRYCMDGVRYVEDINKELYRGVCAACPCNRVGDGVLSREGGGWLDIACHHPIMLST